MEKYIKAPSRKSTKRLIIDASLGVLLFVACVYLFYHQAIWSSPTSPFPSDLSDHIRNVGMGHGYSLNAFFLGLILQHVPNPPVGIAIFEAALVVATWVASTCFIKKFFGKNIDYPELVALPLLFLTSCYLPLGEIGYYRNSLITQPWHNITYIGMRLFAILTMHFFVEVLQKPGNKMPTVREWLLISILLAIATSIKPNFLLTFGLTLAIYIAVKFGLDVYHGDDLADAIKSAFAMGSVVIPSLIILKIQSQELYGTPDQTGQESGLVLQFIESRFFADGILTAAIKTVFALAFPVLLLFIQRKNAADVDRFFFWHYLAALAIVIVLAETGPRAAHGNFSWGLYNAAYLLYLWFAPWFVVSCKQQFAESGRIGGLSVGCAVLLGCQYFSGLQYFLLLLSGQAYLC